MYAVGTSILYGRMGVCQVESIGASPFPEENGRPYYKLRARFSSSGERVYIPVGAEASMRPLVDGGAASGYLALLPRLEVRAFHARRPADLTDHYQKLLATCRLEDCLILLKELYCKQKELAARSRKLGQVDIRYQKLAERLVCEEFAAALDTTPDFMRGRLYAAMEPEAAKQ